ncbi:hypothetical protein Lal_00027740 [Lupinus albus]|nr:hypothetical protein Lal_00027740 [Lupinus albus]
MSLKLNGKCYRTTVRAMLASRYQILGGQSHQENQLNVVDMRMLNQMSGHKRKDQTQNECMSGTRGNTHGGKDSRISPQIIWACED